jgi:hypothetical protein
MVTIASVPTEGDARALDAVFQAAYEQLEGIASSIDSFGSRELHVTLEDIGAVSVLIDKVSVQLTQSTRMRDEMSSQLRRLVGVRAEQIWTAA